MESDNEHRISVVEQRVSQLETEVQVIRVSYVPNDALGALQVDVNQRFGEVGQRFNEVGQRFNEVDLRFAKVDAEFVVVHAEIGHLATKVDKLEDKVDALQAEVRDLKGIFFRALMLNNIAMFGLFAAVLHYLR